MTDGFFQILFLLLIYLFDRARKKQKEIKKQAIKIDKVLEPVKKGERKIAQVAKKVEKDSGLKAIKKHHSHGTQKESYRPQIRTQLQPEWLKRLQKKQHQVVAATVKATNDHIYGGSLREIIIGHEILLGPKALRND